VENAPVTGFVFTDLLLRKVMVLMGMETEEGKDTLNSLLKASTVSWSSPMLMDPPKLSDAAIYELSQF
jgi:hypothetical protein